MAIVNFPDVTVLRSALAQEAEATLPDLLEPHAVSESAKTDTSAIRIPERFFNLTPISRSQ